MKFGKSHMQRAIERNKKLDALMTPHRWFAWYPIQLATGEIIWFEYVTRELMPSCSYDRWYYQEIK